MKIIHYTPSNSQDLILYSTHALLTHVPEVVYPCYIGPNLTSCPEPTRKTTISKLQISSKWAGKTMDSHCFLQDRP